MAKVDIAIPAKATQAYLAPIDRKRSLDFFSPATIVSDPVKDAARVSTTPMDPITRFITFLRVRCFRYLPPFLCVV